MSYSAAMASAWLGRVLVVGSVAGLAAAACSAGGGSGGVAGGGGTSANGGGGTGNTSGGGNSGGSGAIIGTGGSDGGPTNKLGCTPDLQSVVSESGAVVKTCAPDQGCFEGECLPPCEAAGKAGGNIGCDFYAPDPPFTGQGWAGAYSQLLGPCYAVFLANAWKRSVKIQVTRGGQTFDVTSFARIPKGNIPNVTYQPLPTEGLPPDEVAILFLSHKPGVQNQTSLECPIPPALLDNAAAIESGRGQAFRVTTDTPVSAYAILPYGGARSYLPSATLLFPATAYGKNYVTMSPHDLPDPAQPPGRVWAHVVGTVNGTTVDIVPQKALPGGAGVAAAPAGQKTTYSLNEGEILQWLGADTNGMIIASDQPVGLFTGTTYLHAPSATSSSGGHDATHQQIPPVGALGSEYAAPLIVTRLNSLQQESIPHRIVGVVDGTQLSWEPAPPAGAPSVLNAGNVVEFQTNQPFVVRSQGSDFPFLLSNYMPGSILSSGTTRPGCSAQPPAGAPPNCHLGDEDWVVILPPQQFLNRYVFFTDPTYSTTNLVITRLNTGSGFKDVQVECLGTVTGWQPVGSSGDYEVAYVDLMRGGVAVGQCGVSRHVASSDAPFGVVVWGTDWFSSYGYPAGGNVRTINDVYVPPQPR